MCGWEIIARLKLLIYFLPALWSTQLLATQRPLLPKRSSSLKHTHNTVTNTYPIHWYFLSLNRRVKGGWGSSRLSEQLIVDAGENHLNFEWKLTYRAARDGYSTEGDFVPKLSTVLCLCIQVRFNRGIQQCNIYRRWHYRAAAPWYDTIHFQSKESQTLLAGRSIVAKVLIVLFYLTAGVTGFWQSSVALI